MPSLEPRSLTWRLLVATRALGFFAPHQNRQMRTVISRNPQTTDADGDSTIKPLNVAGFLHYLNHEDPSVEWFEEIHHIRPILRQLVRSGRLELAHPTGLLFADQYWATLDHGITRFQRGGYLWLADVLGPELIVRTIGAATVLISGRTREGGFGTGSGIVLDDSHVLTNAHVVRDMRLDEEITTSSVSPPWYEHHRVAPGRARVVKFHVHDRVDMAVIEIEPVDEAIYVPQGLAFRDPVWADDVITLGYPPVPCATESPLIVHRGEVVNPEVGMLDGPGFLYSATTRGGNSGGPVVALDGRVVGLVAHAVFQEGNSEAPYFRSIPSSTLAQAATELGFSSLIRFEDWSGQEGATTGPLANQQQ
ncbi:S1 family peptidase [Nocardia mikamii]|uniref:S1 family peptidase n=1 Tax=Nocardia mikamii TaxID=508464 RepID=UPI000AEE5C99|nr:serine protease [Nocardia mikamii]